MPTPVLITLIICATVLAIMILAVVVNVVNAKKTQKLSSDIMKNIFKEDD